MVTWEFFFSTPISLTLILLSLAIISISKLLLSQNKILMLLLSMEFFNLIMFLAFMSISNMISYMFVFSFLTIIVCEAAVGLTLLTRLSRNIGNDYISIFKLKKLKTFKVLIVTKMLL